MALDPYERYEEKPFIGSSHTWAFEQIEQALARRDDAHSIATLRFLDIGPGSGIIGRHLKDKGATELFAVEIDEKTRAKLHGVYKTIVSDLSELGSEERFDFVFLLDVLEHMSDPYAFLESLQPRLNSGAILFISVPNITHWAIRLMMLFGFFEYMDRGPLDRTHLQFFSRKRFTELHSQIEGGELVDFRGTIEPLELVLPAILTDNLVFQTASRFRCFLARIWPALFAYQFVGAVLVKNQ